MKRISTLPNLLTLANAGCGLLAISKAIDALASRGDEVRFDRLLEASCWLILLAGVLDALDGRIARMTDSFSDFGAQLDSFADAITFGVAPAMIAKVLLEHEDLLHPRIHFLAAASFSLMAVLRLARFNLDNEHDDEAHKEFLGLPSPAAAGSVITLVLIYLSFSGTIEVDGGGVTPVGRGVEIIPLALRETVLTVLPLLILMALPLLGLLMVSGVRYSHAAATLLGGQTRFPVLVRVVFVAAAMYLAPVPVLFITAIWYVGGGLVHHLLARRRSDNSTEGPRRAA